ncbi:MAG: tetratricopeptide repeat protein [Synergistaceae bacterium]|nr:tetratricopeptide repeat protein [Synergistaceae bacterium]
MKYGKQYLFFSSVIMISFILFAASGAEFSPADPDPEKEELAKRIFFEIRHVEDPAEKAKLYRKAADECAGTELAQEALWRLSQLYLSGFDEPDVNQAIACLERFVKTYPDSEWRSHAEFSLLGLYENEKLWGKAVALCEKLMEENPDMPRRMKEELQRRFKAAKGKN